MIHNSSQFVRSAAVALILLLPSSSFALDGELTNQQTGADSVNTNTITNTTDISATIANTAVVNNVFDFNLNTGGNTITNNTTVGDVTTGDVNVELVAETKVNEVDPEVLNNLLDQLGSNSTSSIQSTNSNTGANSQNNNQTTTSHTSNVQVTKTMNVTNSLALDINTGNNTIADNTTVGDISTGNISVIAKVITEGNGVGGGLLPEEEVDNGGSTNPGPITIAQLPKTEISAAPAKTTSSSTPLAQGGGQFFPAGGNPNMILELLAFVLAAILLVRFQELSPVLLSRLQHNTAKPSVR
jgi:hypothetical protein